MLLAYDFDNLGVRDNDPTLLLHELHRHLLQPFGGSLGRVEEGHQDALPQRHRLLCQIL